MSEHTFDPDTLLARYVDGPDHLAALVAGLGEAELGLCRPGEPWSIRHHVHHLVDGDALWTQALKAALGRHHDQFSLGWYWSTPQDEWADDWRYAELDIGPALALLHASRHQIAELLRLRPAAWQRTLPLRTPEGATHEITVGGIVLMQGDHIFAHLPDIQMIRQIHGV